MSASPQKTYLERRAALSAAGICIICGKAPRTERSLRCETCSGKHAAYQRRYQSKLNNKRHPDSARYMHMGADGATFQEIGDALGISRSRAEQIYDRAISKLWRECKRLDLDLTDIIGRGFSSLALCEKWASE